VVEGLPGSQELPAAIDDRQRVLWDLTGARDVSSDSPELCADCALSELRSVHLHPEQVRADEEHDADQKPFSAACCRDAHDGEHEHAHAGKKRDPGVRHRQGSTVAQASVIGLTSAPAPGSACRPPRQFGSTPMSDLRQRGLVTWAEFMKQCHERRVPRQVLDDVRREERRRRQQRRRRRRRTRQ
jgi:hypothetical protein